MPVANIRHVNITAQPQLLRAVRDFYRDVLGLVEGERPPFNRPGYWLYAGDEPILHLIVPPADEVRATPASTTLDHVAFGCEDYEAMRARLDALGVDYRSTEVPLIRQRQLFCRDPAGNGVELLFAAQ